MITLPYPPSANVYWRVWNGRVLLSREARSYKQKAALLAKSQGATPIEGDVELRLSVFRPRRSGDLSNRIKVLEDALNGVAFVDDSQVVRIVANRFDDKSNPRVEVEIVPVP